MGAQFFAAWLADQCACRLVACASGVCRGFSPPSKSQTPATNADFFRPSVPNPPKRRFSCSPTRTFPSSPATKSCPRHPTRHLPASLKLTRRPPADEIPRDLGLFAASCIRPSTVFPRPWQPSQARCTQHPAPNSTAPHLISHSPLPRLTSSTTGACPAHQRRSSCDDPGTASSAPRHPRDKAIIASLFRARIDCDSQKPSALHHQRR